MARQLGLRITDLPHVGAEAAEILGHGEAEIARFGQLLVVRLDERVVAVVLGGAGCKEGAELACEADESVVAVAGRGRTREVAHLRNVRRPRAGD